MKTQGVRVPISPGLAVWLAVAGCAVLAVATVVVAVASPGYDATRETTSQMMDEGAKYPTLSRLVLAAYALLLVPMAWRLPAVVKARRQWVALVTVGLWLHIFFSLVAAAFQNDSAATVVWGVTENQIHDDAAGALFAAAILALASAAFSSGNPFASRFTVLSAASALVMFAAGLAFVFQIATDVHGIFERAGMVAFMGWVLVIAVAHNRNG